MNRAIIELGVETLDVLIAPGTDVNEAFDAIDAETGEHVRIYGWQIDSIEFDRSRSIY